MADIKLFLLIVDIQNGFIDKKTDFVRSRTDNLLSKNVFDCVIATVYQNFNSSPISKFMDWHKMQTKNEQAVTGKARDADKFIYKNTYSAFSESLTDYLRTKNNGTLPETIFITGVDTECCVLMTAADFFEAGIHPIVLTHYCGSSGGKRSHKAGKISLESIIGKNNISDKTIRSKKDVAEILRISHKD